jgi:hypothetical protein
MVKFGPESLLDRWESPLVSQNQKLLDHTKLVGNLFIKSCEGSFLNEKYVACLHVNKIIYPLIETHRPGPP